jgi:threonine dehydrogenase-like Zn-dependent dehydrogenase
MEALARPDERTAHPGTLKLHEVDEPEEELGSVLIEAVAVGICGTDVELASPGGHGWARHQARTA